MLGCASALVHCAYRDKASGGTGNDHDYFKARSLQMINKAFDNPDSAVSDENIVAVIYICVYEVNTPSFTLALRCN
jgi:hypothetical protein